MYIRSSQSDQSEAYLLVFNNLRFAFLSSLNLSNLQYFCQSNQEKLGKCDIRLNIDYLKDLPQHDNIDYVVMTEYNQILGIPYLLRRNKKNQGKQIKIIATKSIVEQAQIYALDFYQNIKKINQIIQKLSFDEESLIEDNYEIQYSLNFKKWVPIFSRSQLTDCFNKFVGINYKEKYNTERGVIITPFPSGINIGSACWIFQNCLTKQNLLWIQKLSHHKWRACRQFSVDTVYNKIDTVVFTSKSLVKTDNPKNDEIECLEFLKMIFQRLKISKGHNSKIVLSDFLILCDIINYIVYQFNQKFKHIFITGASVSKMMCYTNSLVEYLSQNHQKRIYEDPPSYPFQSYQDLKSKKINEGTLVQLSQIKKVPIKQLILRSTPYLHFESDFHAYLYEQFGSVISEQIFQPRVDLQTIKQWIKRTQISNVLYYCHEEQDAKKFHDFHHILTLLPIGEYWTIPSRANSKFYTSQGQITGLLGKYTKRNGWVFVEPAPKMYRILKQNWTAIIAAQLQQLGYTVVKQQQNAQIQTAKTIIKSENYKLSVSSCSQTQLLQVSKIIEKITTVFKLI